MSSTLNAYAPRVLSFLRIVSGLMFMQHGAQKIFGFPAEAMGPFNIASQMGVGGVLELVGGALIVLGLFTRPVAFVLSGMMAVAYFPVPRGRGRSLPPGEPGRTGRALLLGLPVFRLRRRRPVVAGPPGPEARLTAFSARNDKGPDHR